MQQIVNPTYQVSKRIQLLAHEAALLPPPRNFSVEKVKKQSKGQEPQRDPNHSVLRGIAEAVAQRGEDGHGSATAYANRLAWRSTGEKRGGLSPNRRVKQQKNKNK